MCVFYPTDTILIFSFPWEIVFPLEMGNFPSLGFISPIPPPPRSKGSTLFFPKLAEATKTQEGETV